MKTFKKSLSKLMVLIMLLSSFNGYGGVMRPSFADTDLNLSLEHTSDNLTPKTGKEFIYTLKYGVSGSYNGSNSITGLTIVETVDEALQFALPDRNADIKSITSNGNQITIEFNDDLASGTTGVLPFRAWFKEGVTPNGTEADCSAVFSVGDISKSAAAPTVTATTLNIDQIEVEKVANPEYPALDNYVYYTIKVEREPRVGGRNILDVTVADTLPDDVTEISAVSPSGGVVSGNTVTWSNQTIEVGGAGSVKEYVLRCKYPNGDFSLGANVTNGADVSGYHVGESTPITGQDSVTHQFYAPSVGGLSIQKHNRPGSSNPDKYAKGQTAQFTISGVANNGNVEINSVDVFDILPVEAIDSESLEIQVGGYNSDVDIDLYYSTDDNLDYDNVDAADFVLHSKNIAQMSSVALNTTSGGAINTSASAITAVKLSITGEDGAKLPVGFKAISNIGVRGTVSANASDTTYANKLKAFIYADSGNIASTSNANFKVSSDIPWYDISLTTRNASYLDLDNIDYTLTLKNNALARGYITDAIVGVEFIDERFDGYIAPTSLPAGVNELADVTATVDGKARTYKRWHVNGPLEPGESISIEFKNSFRTEDDKLRVGSYDNLAFVVEENGEDVAWETNNFVIDESAYTDLDGDGDQNGKLITNTCSVFNKFQGKINGKKWIKGEKDLDYVDPTNPDTQEAIAHTLSGGYVSYKLEISNEDGNGPISDIVVVDKLPAVGDTNILSSPQRGSQWTPYLIGEAKILAVPNGYSNDNLKVYYSTLENPDVSILDDTTKSINASDWTDTAPAEIIDVRNILFKLDGISLDVGQKVEVEFKMVAPSGAPVNQKIYNSFAFGGTYPDSTAAGKSAFLANEPPAVSHIVEASGDGFTIGNRAFYDVNNDGLDNDVDTAGNKKGINGVRVILFKENSGANERIRHTYSNKNADDIDGYYEFPTTLANGNYKVLCAVLKSKDLHISALNVGEDGTAESNLDNDFELLADTTGYSFEDGLDTDDYNFYIYKTKSASNIIGLTGTTDGDKVKYAQNTSIGFYKYAKVGGKVFNDKNQNGKKDTGEDFLAGAKVSLTCAANAAYDKATVTTTDNGEYEFTDVIPADYTLKVETPSAQYAVSATVGNSTGINNDFAKDDANPTISEMAITVLSEADIVKNAGMHRGIINGLLWFDKNYNGTKDAGEVPLSGFTVKLYENTTDVSNAPLKTFTTGANGIYMFDDLDAGTYKVKIIPKVPIAPNSKAFKATVETNKVVGEDYSNDNSYVIQSDPNKNIIKDIALEAAGLTGNIGGGFSKDITLQGYIFNDVNLDGQFSDADDKSKFKDNANQDIDSISLVITGGNLASDATENVVANWVEANGRYEYAVELEPSINAYTIKYANPDSINFVPSLEAADAQNLVKNENNKNVFSQSAGDIEFTLNSPLSSLDDADSTYYINSGLHKSTVTVDLFEDDDYSGAKEASEGFLRNNITNPADRDVIIQLQKSDGTVVQEVYPTSLGVTFSKVNNGNYRIVVKIKQNKDYRETKDSNPTKSTEGIASTNYDVYTYSEFTVGFGSTTNKKIGFYRPAKIKTIVFYDKDYDGVRETGESKAGLITEIKPRYSDATLGDAFTNIGDVYTSGDLVPGTYKIHYTINQPASAPDGEKYYITQCDRGDDALDSDISKAGVTEPTTAVFSDAFTLTSGQVLEHIDLGLYKKVKITGSVFKEQNATPDGLKNGADTHYGGSFTATVKNGNDVIETTPFASSDTTGDYVLYLNPYREGVQLYYTKPAGYHISPENHTAGNDVTGNGLVVDAASSQDIQLTSDGDKSFDYGVYEANSIAGMIYHDNDGDGSQGSSETAIAGTVQLLASDGTVLQTANVGDDGQYNFTNLKFGTYKVKVTKTDFKTATTEDIVLNTNDDATKDIGIFKYASISGKVFNDLNHNGKKEDNEPFFKDVEVYLEHSSHGKPTQTTLADGIYNFTAVYPNPADFVLRVEAPSDEYAISIIPADGTIKNEFTAEAGTPSRSQNMNLAIRSGDQIEKNAGMHRGIINGVLWFDKNHNGKKDADESALSGFTVKLFENNDDVTTVTSKAEFTTGTNGIYMFDDLDSGTYKLQIVPAVQVGEKDFRATVKTANPADGNYNSDKSYVIKDDPNKNIIEDVLLDAAGSVGNIGGGFYKEITLQGYIFNDTNMDGVFTAADAKNKFTNNVGSELGSITLTITGGDLDSAKSVTANWSATNGRYEYAIVLDPSINPYTISYANPDSTTFVLSTVAANPQTLIKGANAQSVFSKNGANIEFTVNSPLSSVDDDENIFYINSGLHKSIVTVRLFEDDNYDGSKNGAEGYLAGLSADPNDKDVILELQQLDGTVVQTIYATSLDSEFNRVNNGDYKLVVKIKSDKGFMPTLNNDTTSTTTETIGGVNYDVYEYPSFTVSSGSTTDNSIGFFKYATVNTKVFFDENCDGINQAGEAKTGMISSVELYNGTTKIKHFTANVTEDLYTANDLAPGTYKIVYRFNDDYLVTKRDQGADDTTDSDLAPPADSTEKVVESANFSLICGQTFNGMDLGLYKNVKITGHVFKETDGAPNGEKDGSDVDYSGTFAATLKDDSGNVVETVVVTVNTGGAYSFEVTPSAAQLTLSYSLPTGYFVSPKSSAAGGNDVAADGAVAAFKPTSDVDRAFDYGLYPVNTISGTIYHDVDANGDYTGESGIAAEVHLLDGAGNAVNDASGNPITVDANADGSYRFANIASGDYRVKVVKSGYEGSETANVVSVGSGQTAIVDLAVYKKVVVSGYVFAETGDALNGKKDGSDLYYSGAFTATLKDDQGIVVDTVTVTVNADGAYSFEVTPSDKVLTLSYSLPTGYFVSPKSSAANGNDVATDGTVEAFKPTSGDDKAFEYGLYSPNTIAGTIYHDLDANGDYTAESGIAAEVHLLDGDGNAVNDASGNPIKVDANVDGSYRFENLPAGDYKVKVVKSGYEDAVGEKIVAGSGQNKVQDLGIYQKSTISGVVFEDVDRNGKNDKESGFSDIQIQVQLGSDNIGAPITPDADGSFTTIALKPGNYHLKVILENGYYRVSPKDVGVDDAVDSDVQPSSLISDTINVQSGSPVANVGIGVYKLVTIRGKVEEMVENSASNTPLKGAKVHLLDSSGNAVMGDDGKAIVVKTDASGNYSIPNLYPYTVYKLKVISSYDNNGTIVNYPVTIRAVAASSGGVVVENFVSEKHVIHLVADPAVIVGDGASTSELTFTIKYQDGRPAQNTNVKFDANLDRFGNDIPTSKKGTFNNALAATPIEITVRTDDDGKAVVTFKSANLRGFLEKQTVMVRATANLDNGERLEDSIVMILEPLSIKGTVKGSGDDAKVYANAEIRIRQVIDKNLADDDPRLMAAFKDGYKLSKISSGENAGKLLFEYTGRTDENGGYKIFVPYDGIDEDTSEPYDVNVIIPAEESPTNKELVFVQRGDVNKQTQTIGTSSDDNEVDSEKTIVGTLIMTHEDDDDAVGSGSVIVTDNSKIKVKYTQAGNTLQYSVDDDGVLVSDAANAKLTNARYTRDVYYTFDDGREIIIASQTFSSITNGDLIVEDILIDPRGFVTDYNTGAPVAGAKVTLYDNETGEVVPLPASSLGFSNNANPQYTTAIGEYAWMVFPGIYYILAEADGYLNYDSRTDGGDLRYVGQESYTATPVGLITVADLMAFWNFKMKPIINGPDADEDSAGSDDERSDDSSSGSSSGRSSESSNGGYSGDAVVSTTTQTDKDLYRQEIEVEKRLIFAGETIELNLNYINKSAKTLNRGYLKVNLPADLELIPEQGQVARDGYIYIDVVNLKPNDLRTASINLSTDKVRKISDYNFESVLVDRGYSALTGLSHAMLRVYYVETEEIFDGYMIGRPDGGFHSYDNITRAEVAAVLVRQTEHRYDTPEVTGYSDVNEDDWYYDILSEAIAYGYFTGYSDGTFKPDKYMTRGEIAEAIARFFKIDIASEDGVTQFFTDVEGTKYEREINLVARNSLMNGYPDKTFKPNAYTTRAEAAKFFNGLFNRYPTANVEPSFNDVAKNFWAYGHIESAFRGFRIVNTNGEIKVFSREKENPYK